MSFSSNIRDELGALPIKSTCCRRAYLHGLIFGATVTDDTLSLTFPLPPASAYDLPVHACSLIHTLLGRQATVSPLSRGAHRYARLTFESKPVARSLAKLVSLPDEEAAADTISATLGFKCAGCAAHFLRGLFIACGTVNDPAKSFHLEYKLPRDGRVEPTRILLSETDFVPGYSVKDGQARLFFKSAEDIGGLLAHLGATGSTFRFLNAQIEREIRNNENRATNCVTENINRSTRAVIRQITAIRYLDEHDLLPSLTDDLRYTARLRLEHPEVTLAELAALHAPTITKSGLNHRLEKLLDVYERATASK